MKKSFLLIIVTLIIFGITYAHYTKLNEPQPLTVVKPDTIMVVDTIPIDTIQLSFKDSLYLMMDKYEIHHQDIVYAQAILETGHFKAKIFTKKQNLFGLRGKKGYYTFKHWSESIKMYKEKIQSRYREGEDYYKFLKRIHYAENPKYIIILKKVY